MEIIKNRLRHFGELLTDSDTIEENQSVIVPDTHPDALQIIGASAWLNVQEKSCTDGVLKVGGQANCCITYLSTVGKAPYTVNAVVPFSFTKEPQGLTEDDQLLAGVKLLQTSAVMVNPRKLSVRVQLQVFQRLFKCRSAEYAEDIRAEREEGVHTLREKHPMRVLADIVEKRLVVGDEIRLSAETPNEECVILRRETEWISEDVRILPNKIMIRGRIDAGLTTMNKQGGFLGKSKYSVPFSQIIECDGVYPEDRAIISYAPTREEIELMTGPDQVTTMRFSFAAVTECRIEKGMELVSVRDVFSTKWQMESKTALLTAPLEERAEVLTIPVKESILLEGNAVKVLSLSVCPEDQCIERGETVASAGYHIHLVYQEEDGSILTACKKLHAEGQLPAAIHSGGWCQAGFADADAKLVGAGEAHISFEARLTIHDQTGPLRNVISDCTILKNAPKKIEEQPSLIIRAIPKETSVWEIAKQYGAPPSLIASANKVEADSFLEAGRMALIPFVNR